MQRIVVLATVVSGCLASVCGAPYVELVPEFDRLESNVMARKIPVPTRANLDYAAYHANPVLFEPEKFKPKAPGEAVTLEAMTFGGYLSDVVNSIDKTPLTDAEKERPMAWQPLNKELWEVTKDMGFQSVTGKINGYKWADPSVHMPYQEIATAYVHHTGEGREMWVKIEFSFWVKFLDAATDSDNDGIDEVYGRLSLKDADPAAVKKAFAWITGDYLVKTLDRQGVIDWITELASYWYPTKNSDIVDQGEHEYWPNEDTKDLRRIKRTMKKTRIKDPIAVVEAKPFDPKHPVYNVYVVEGLKKEDAEDKAETSLTDKVMDTTVSQNFKENGKRFKDELDKHGGSYEKWAAECAGYVEAQKKAMADVPETQMGIPGKDGWVFFRKSFEYTTAGELGGQPRDKNPLPHLKELKAFLDKQNVNLLFVVVPTKPEVYFEKLPVAVKADATAVINPYGRKFLKDVQDAGIEVIDLLPHLLKAKTRDAEYDEPVYQKQDTHWGYRGQQIAVDLIAERIKAYSWYDDAGKTGIEYTIVDTTFERRGDNVDVLPEKVKVEYPAATLKARQVHTPGGALIKRTLKGPLLVMGDSFTGVFELIDCKGAGLVSHITAQTGCQTGHLISWGGGPLVREQLARRAEKTLPSKRLVIYVMVARDLYNYKQGWADFKVE
ncbi:MAG: hypothetical protein GF418_12930 [Chitinivibrionales bacterium]|nr:hypothetical protein [Chitinivibrionales bacterium]MBD3396523.1 hypothetical protein [Chitinivibrionales bacterium]